MFGFGVEVTGKFRLLLRTNAGVSSVLSSMATGDASADSSTSTKTGMCAGEFEDTKDAVTVSSGTTLHTAGDNCKTVGLLVDVVAVATAYDSFNESLRIYKEIKPFVIVSYC